MLSRKLIITISLITITVAIFFFIRAKEEHQSILKNYNWNKPNWLTFNTPPEPEPVVPEKPKHIWYETRQALYLPGILSLQDETLTKTKASGFNTIIIDIKKGDGQITYPSQVPLALELKNTAQTFPDLAAHVQKLHDLGFVVVARQVVFWDNILSEKKPEYRVAGQYGRTSQNWVDPSLPAVWDYNFAVSAEAVHAGVDEVQYDYIRFPVNNVSGSSFAFDSTKFTKADILVQFLNQARTNIKTIDPEVKFSLDIFGIAAWDNHSAKNLGQEIDKIGPTADILYPMVYPSHFNDGFDGYANPADYPEYFVSQSIVNIWTKLCPPTVTPPTNENSTTETPTTETIATEPKPLPPACPAHLPEIMPWLQGFSLKVTNYNAEYITRQIKSSAEKNSSSFAFWNSGKIDTILAGMKNYNNLK